MSEELITDEIISPNNTLTPLESSLIGSSVTYRGNLLNTQSLEQGIKDGSIGEDIFLPMALINGLADIGVVKTIREKRKYLSGYLACFEAESQIDLDDKGLVPALELPKMDPENGFVLPAWKVKLINRKGEVIDDKEKLAKIVLNERKQDYFDLAFNNDELVLSFHP